MASKPIPADDALLGFPSAKATVASLLAEGPREGPLPNIKVLSKATGSASSSGLKAGGTHSYATLHGLSFSTAASDSMPAKKHGNETLPEASEKASSSRHKVGDKPSTDIVPKGYSSVWLFHEKPCGESSKAKLLKAEASVASLVSARAKRTVLPCLPVTRPLAARWLLSPARSPRIDSA